MVISFSLGAFYRRMQVHYWVQILNFFSYLLYSLLILSHYFPLFPLYYLFWASDIYFYNWNWAGLLRLLLFFWFLELHVCLTIFPLFFGLQPQKNSLVFFGGFTVTTGFLFSINGGRPLMLFGLVWADPLTCTSC